MRRLIVVLALTLIAPLRAHAQTGAAVSYLFEVFDIAADPLGAGKAVWSMTLPASAALCNLAQIPPPTTLTQINPQAVFWNDPVNAGKLCKASTILLGTLPTNTPGAYVLTVSVTTDRGSTSARSTVSGPFNNAPPLALAGVMVR